MSRKLYADISCQIPQAGRLEILQASLEGESILVRRAHPPNRIRLQRMVWHNEALHIEAYLKGEHAQNL